MYICIYVYMHIFIYMFKGILEIYMNIQKFPETFTVLFPVILFVNILYTYICV